MIVLWHVLVVMLYGRDLYLENVVALALFADLLLCTTPTRFPAHRGCCEAAEIKKLDFLLQGGTVLILH